MSYELCLNSGSSIKDTQATHRQCSVARLTLCRRHDFSVFTSCHGFDEWHSGRGPEDLVKFRA